MEKERFLKQLGNNIISIRLENNISQSELARLCDKEPQSIERVENGKINPSAFYLRKLAEALNVPLERFFKGL